jgi:hypothetical protein
MLRAAALVGFVPALFLSACSPAGPRSRLVDNTVVGHNRCNPAEHDRPFVIEWDATDMSNFEAHAQRDVVLVRYEGCALKVLTGCRKDSVAGSLGTYRPVAWTSGSLEKVDIATENELYAKLPLGVATLGGRVRDGESLHMEYYVAGTRNATREGVYRGDLSELPACSLATHFVYSYNLGAFALGSASDVVISAEGSAYGFGTGGKTSQSSKREKRGGELASCKADAAKELDGCKVPIRLTLRTIAAGENPERVALKVADTSESLNAAGKVDRKLEMSTEARARYEAAILKQRAGDGAGCLDELGHHDTLDPVHPSTEPRSGLGDLRGTCLMLSGECDAGKGLLRRSLEATGRAGPEQLERMVDVAVGRYCQGAKMTPRDRMLRALHELQAGASERKTPASCASAWQAVKQLSAEVKPGPDSDPCRPGFAYDPRYDRCGPGMEFRWMASQCVAHAGDCPGAWQLIREEAPLAQQSVKPEDNGSRDVDMLWHSFGMKIRDCRSWFNQQQGNK